MSVLDDLIETLSEHPEIAFVRRQERDYDKFLRFYEKTGNAPLQREALGKWRERSRDTWRRLDARLPGTMTGGMASEEIVSSWGTLPLSANAVYSHSVCMLETLAATATTFAQALHSLTWVEKIPGIQYWAGSNATEFNVTALQKPKDFKIPHQLELEMVRCVPAVTSITRPSADLLLVAVLEEHRALLSSNHQAIVAELERAHPLLNGLHSVAAATVQDRADGTPLALVLLQTALPELTVANVYSWVWVFPFDKGIEWIDLCRRLRSLEILSTVPLQIAVQLGSALHRNSDEKLTPSCWRFTHKRELPLLRKSFQETFGSLLIQYSEQEVQAFAAMLGQ